MRIKKALLGLVLINLISNFAQAWTCYKMDPSLGDNDLLCWEPTDFSGYKAALGTLTEKKQVEVKNEGLLKIDSRNHETFIGTVQDYNMPFGAGPIVLSVTKKDAGDYLVRLGQRVRNASGPIRLSAAEIGRAIGIGDSKEDTTTFWGIGTNPEEF
jgi:hypothetical protein